MRALSFATMAVLGISVILALAQAPPLDPAMVAWPDHQPGIGYSPTLSACANNILATIGEGGTTQSYQHTPRASLLADSAC